MRDEKILDFIVRNGIRTNKGAIIEFKKHGFLLDILCDFSPRLVVRKASQVGVSFTILLKLLYLGDKRDLYIIYTMPTNPEAREFVLSKLDPMIEKSAGLRSKVVKVPFRGKPVYSTTMKRLGGSFYFFRGSWSPWKAQSIDADILVFDELDLQKPGIMSMYRERLTGSASENIIYSVSNPSLPGYGISELYENSDQREWFIQCPRCKKRQILKWPDSIDLVNERYICRFCGRILYEKHRRIGEWVPRFPSRNIHGYAISRLMAPWISAKRLIEIYRKRPPKHFYNRSLGLPYLEHGEVISGRTIRNCLSDAEHKFSENIVCGIDQGDEFHVLIADAGGQAPHIFGAKVAKSVTELEDILNYYQPKLTLIDMLPAKHLAKQFQKKYGKDKFLLVNLRDFQLSTLKDYLDYKRSLGMINLERTESIDRMVERLKRGRSGITFASDLFHIKTISTHLSNLNPDYQERYGRTRKVWKSTGKDDFAFALDFLLAGVEILNPSLHAIKGTEKKKRYPLSPEAKAREDFDDRIDKLTHRKDTLVIKPRF